MRFFVRAVGVLMVLASGAFFFFWKTGLDWDFWMKTGEVFNVVVVDAGHGGTDPGAMAGGHREKTLTLQMAATLADELAAHGFEVILTREGDENLALSERVQIGNKARNAIFVSLHFNSASNKEARGLETFFHDPRKPEFKGLPENELPQAPEVFIEPADSEILAAFIQSRMVAAVNAPDRGIKNRGFHVLRNASHPAVLVEGGFISNALELQLLLNDGYLDSLARSVREGIVDYREFRIQNRGDARRS